MNSLFRTVLYFVTLIILAISQATACVAEPKADILPRYKFEPLTQWNYVGTTVREFTEDEKEKETAKAKLLNEYEWNFLVLRENSDKSFRCLMKKVDVDKENSGNNRSLLGYIDIFSDGRMISDDSCKYLSPIDIVPRLPRDAQELKAGWQLPSEQIIGSYNYHHLPDINSKNFLFQCKRQSLFDEIYEQKNTTALTFDPKLGRLTSNVTTGPKAWLSQAPETTTIEFKTTVTMKKEDCEKILHDIDLFFPALKKIDDNRPNDCNYDVEKFKKVTEEKNKILAETQKELQSSIFIDEMKNKIEEQQSYIEYELKCTEKMAKVFNAPSPEWDANDLDGKKHSLSDYKGKVVVLDFWYRGCGWCVRAMPEMNKLAKHYQANKSVQILGINTDSEKSDAQFVVDKMGLTYPNLLAKEIPEKYAVTGFPTLIIIDRNGIVRRIHDGYRPDMHNTLITDIDKLLKE